jgi:transposase
MTMNRHGIVYYRLIRGYLDRDSYLDYLKALRQVLVKDKKYTLYFDNLAVHTHSQNLSYLWGTKIKAMRAIAYRCEFNPCEYLFSKIKKRYREETLKELAIAYANKTEPRRMLELVTNSIEEFVDKDHSNLIRHVLKEMIKDGISEADLVLQKFEE